MCLRQPAHVGSCVVAKLAAGSAEADGVCTGGGRVIGADAIGDTVDGVDDE